MSARLVAPVLAVVLGIGAVRWVASPASAAAQIGAIDVPTTTSAPPIDTQLNDAAWHNAAVAHLDYDLRNHQPADQRTTVYLVSDGAFLYVGIDARQTTPIRATEHTNGVGLDTDDEFQVDLWPNGPSGFRYKFTSTPIGTHYQYSSENNSFEPEWVTRGRIVDGGYVVTMRIPLSVMHGTGSGDWRMQLIRYVAYTNDVYVWSYGPQQLDFNDVAYSGSLAGLRQLPARRAQPRVGVYGLGEIASRTIGGDTSRLGADISIPLVQGTSFVSTLHPDYSDVEVDQQTIAPTAFPRIFNEFRPFFTQGANVYSYPNGICAACPGIIEFYTPAIPTPRDGYAFEGQHGRFSYGALHTDSAFGRTDTADAIDYVTPDQHTALNFQGSHVDAPGLHDATNGITLTQDNRKDFEYFARYADDAGTNVLDKGQSERYEGGAQWYQPDGTAVQVVERKVGTFFDPVDGLVQHPDITGYDVNFFKPFKFATTARFTQFNINGDLARYHDHAGGLDQTDNNLHVSLTTRTLFNIQASTGSAYTLLPTASPAPPVFTPITQNGLQLGYNLNGLLPTFASLSRGRFGPGMLDSWARSATIRVGTRGALTAEADDTDQFVDTGWRLTEWLERVSYGYQSGPDQSIALGVRRITGFSPELIAQSVRPTVPNDAWNLSAAFRKKVPGGELYIVYGDAAAFATSPRFIVKYIKYFGADKGT